MAQWIISDFFSSQTSTIYSPTLTLIRWTPFVLHSVNNQEIHAPTITLTSLPASVLRYTSPSYYYTDRVRLVPWSPSPLTSSTHFSSNYPSLQALSILPLYRITGVQHKMGCDFFSHFKAIPPWTLNIFYHLLLFLCSLYSKTPNRVTYIYCHCFLSSQSWAHPIMLLSPPGHWNSRFPAHQWNDLHVSRWSCSTQ